jgi:von Willebrand factor type A domain
MRRRERTVSIFTLSALDVLAMSTGVFVLLLVLLMPYYRRTLDANAEIEAVRVAAASTRAEFSVLDADARRLSAEAEAVEEEAEKLNAAAVALELEAAPVPALRPADAGVQPVIEALDLVFVIDTTASMTPAIRELAASMRSLVRILERLVSSVRIGVVEYRDRDIRNPPVRALPLTATDADLPRIVAFVDALEASPVGSRTIEEDLHLGLEAAMGMQLRPGARQALMVIGDAAAHPDLQVEILHKVRTFTRASPEKTVSALFVSTPSSRSRGDRARSFFGELALAGKGSLHDRTGTMLESVLLSVLPG